MFSSLGKAFDSDLKAAILKFCALLMKVFAIILGICAIVGGALAIRMIYSEKEHVMAPGVAAIVVWVCVTGISLWLLSRSISLQNLLFFFSVIALTGAICIALTPISNYTDFMGFGKTHNTGNLFTFFIKDHVRLSESNIYGEMKHRYAIRLAEVLGALAVSVIAAILALFARVKSRQLEANRQAIENEGSLDAQG